MSSPNGSITVPIVCEEANSTSTTTGTKPSEPLFPSIEKLEKVVSPVADATIDAAKVSDHSVEAKVSDHSVELDPAFSQDCTQETARVDYATSTSLQNWQQHVASNSGGRTGRLDSSENMGQGQLTSLGISDDLGTAGTATNACTKTTGTAPDQDIMSSIESAVEWRDNETAGALWHENPLAAAADQTMSSDASQLQGAQRTITSSSLSTVVRNPLVDGPPADGLDSK